MLASYLEIKSALRRIYASSSNLQPYGAVKEESSFVGSNKEGENSESSAFIVSQLRAHGSFRRGKSGRGFRGRVTLGQIQIHNFGNERTCWTCGSKFQLARDCPKSSEKSEEPHA